ncbi:MAG: HD domain-containing protein [Chloroflexi bacterium]|nr:HD domain-containing protein [Chloroflexota bacterium]
MNPGEVDTVRSAARVHDIGKMGFSDDLLRRYALTLDPVDLEFRRHAEVAWQLLGRIAEYRVGREYVRHQCERPDGSGFPMCLPAERIPVGAAIIRVAEAYDVLTSRTEGELAAQMILALTQLRQGSGRLWDARVINALGQIAERRMNALGHEAASFASAEV